MTDLGETAGWLPRITRECCAGEVVTVIQMPSNLDALLGASHARYCPSFSSRIDLNDSASDIEEYLGTYWLRSYAEAFHIGCETFAETYSRREFSMFNAGCGTGGDTAGTISALFAKGVIREGTRLNLALFDGNRLALAKGAEIVAALCEGLGLDLHLTKIGGKLENLEDFKALKACLEGKFDVIQSFKMINELYAEGICSDRSANPYEQFINTFSGSLRGCKSSLVLGEIACRNANPNSRWQQWLPVLLDEGFKRSRNDWSAPVYDSRMYYARRNSFCYAKGSKLCSRVVRPN